MNEIDDDCLSRLDCSEWFRPDVAQAARIDAAAKRLGVYLMPYRAGGSDAVGKGLCRLVVAAKLDAGGVDEILGLEAAYPDIAVVAYERPVRHRQ